MKSVESGIGRVEHVALVIEDVGACRALFEGVLRLPAVETADDVLNVQAGKTTIRIVAPSAPDAAHKRPGWDHVAMRVDDLAETDAHLATNGIRTARRTGSDGRDALWTDPETTAGIPVQFVAQAADPNFPQQDPKCLIERIDHLGVASHDATRARDVYVDTMGFPIESTQIDSEVLVRVETTSNDRHGATSKTHPPISPIGSGLMALFVTIGEFDLEVMQPLSPATITTPLGTIPGTVGQDQGAIARFLERRGEGLLHVCFKTPDIAAALDSVKNAGIGLIDPVGRPGARNSLIAFMDRKDTQGILMHFVQRIPLD